MENKRIIAKVYLVGTFILYLFLIWINAYAFIEGTNCAIDGCYTICEGFQALTLPLILISIIIFTICLTYQILYFKNRKKLNELNGLLVISTTIIVLFLAIYLTISIPVIQMPIQRCTPCAQAFNCECSTDFSKKCTCDVIDKNENVIKIKCNNYSDN